MFEREDMALVGGTIIVISFALITGDYIWGNLSWVLLFIYCCCCYPLIKFVRGRITKSKEDV